IDAKTIDRVRAVPGVAKAAGDITDLQTKILGKDGKVVGGGPWFGVGLDRAAAHDVKLSPFRLKRGTWAEGPGEVVIDAGTADKQDRFTLDGLKGFISIIKGVLLGFGGVALLVGAFTIFNSLSIIVAQRSREFGLLRLAGASRRQVLRTVVVEALGIGAGASA